MNLETTVLNHTVHKTSDLEAKASTDGGDEKEIRAFKGIGMTEDQIEQLVYKHSCDDDEPLFSFSRRDLFAFTRALLSSALAAEGGEASDKQVAELPEVNQDWASVEPSVAFHLIERHAEDWAHAGRMMEAWRAANTDAPQSQVDSECAARGHRLVDARNPIVQSGYLCLDCGAVFRAGDHDAPHSQGEKAVASDRKTQVIEGLRDQAMSMLDAPRSAARDDAIRKLIAAHADELERNDYAYFELAYTRRTGWMAWICSNCRDDDPDRKVIARGQGDTPDEACADAIAGEAAPHPADEQRAPNLPRLEARGTEPSKDSEADLESSVSDSPPAA
ncbi:hypothetical protein [Caballeronia sp. LZ035]|uniref:hypothetical protein n=1 Tax=Caballeronia sp. LZ035 TaxID=3038568 RepID=UPI00285EBA9E|nr:hypothetical protein [Caballeronia sp. LZ035]MDR5761913.1 hypothetical protein [Caballeronia sp. LZ035]